MGYYINNNEEKYYTFDAIGTDIVLDNLNGVQIYSSIVDPDEEKDDPVAYGISNGIVLTGMAFLSEGLSDIVDHPNFEGCISEALDRIPTLTAYLKENGISKPNN